jgi:hypothetical protein
MNLRTAEELVAHSERLKNRATALRKELEHEMNPARIAKMFNEMMAIQQELKKLQKAADIDVRDQGNN